MESVYILMHEADRGSYEDVKVIGAFATEKLAEAAREKLLEVEGFRNHPDGFSIDLYPLNEVNWTEGFVDKDD